MSRPFLMNAEAGGALLPRLAHAWIQRRGGVPVQILLEAELMVLATWRAADGRVMETDFSLGELPADKSGAASSCPALPSTMELPVLEQGADRASGLSWHVRLHPGGLALSELVATDYARPDAATLLRLARSLDEAAVLLAKSSCLNLAPLTPGMVFTASGLKLRWPRPGAWFFTHPLHDLLSAYCLPGDRPMIEQAAVLRNRLLAKLLTGKPLPHPCPDLPAAGAEEREFLAAALRAPASFFDPVPSPPRWRLQPAMTALGICTAALLVAWPLRVFLHAEPIAPEEPGPLRLLQSGGAQAPEVPEAPTDAAAVLERRLSREAAAAQWPAVRQTLLAAAALPPAEQGRLQALYLHLLDQEVALALRLAEEARARQDERRARQILSACVQLLDLKVPPTPQARRLLEILATLPDTPR